MSGRIDPASMVTLQLETGQTVFGATPSRFADFLPSDNLDSPERSRLQLYENGQPLGPAHSVHADVSALGRGRYSHWNGAILFSSSDNSDPRANGRAYRYEDRIRLPEWMAILGLACVAASLLGLGGGGLLASLARRTLGAGRREVAGIRRNAAGLWSSTAAAWRLIAGPAARIAMWGAAVLCGIALAYAALLGIPVRGPLPASTIGVAEVESGARVFVATPLHSRYLREDEPDLPKSSSLHLFEDGRPLGPAHSYHVDIAALGMGRYSHTNTAVYFSASDNTDPRHNGRTYRYEDRVRLAWPFALLGALLVAAPALSRRRGAALALARRVVRHPPLHQQIGLRPAAALMLVFASMLWLFQLLLATEADLSQDDILLVNAYCGLILALQGIAVVRAGRYTAPLFVALGTADAFSLYLVFSGDFPHFSVPVRLAVLVGPAALYFVLFRFLEHAERWRLRVVFAAAIIVSVVGTLSLGSVLLPEPGGTQDLGPESLGLRVVEFKRRPNVYFLGFDAMTPQALAGKLLGAGRPPYVDVIERQRGVLLPNMFAGEVPTQVFWANALSVVRTGDPRKVVVGIEPSLVLQTFLHNGYETHFSYVNSYMGQHKGAFLTTYEVAEPYSTCTFLEGLPRRLGFLGYCALKDTGWFGPPPGDGTPTRGHDEFYLERLRWVMDRSRVRPQFFASHYPWPGHTELTYGNEPGEFAAFRALYVERSAAAASMLDRMLGQIRSRDPSAIVFVFGDHGAWISRRLDYAQRPDYVVQDRHGILGAVFGADECLRHLRAGADRVHVSSRVVAGLLQCLAGGASPLTRPHDFGRISQSTLKPLRFDAYAYE